MIEKGMTVKWNQGSKILSGTVEGIHMYSIGREVKKSILNKSRKARLALFIRVADGTHVLKNDTQVYLIEK
ncbi:hypothetical protein [Aquimarina sp. 433]